MLEPKPIPGTAAAAHYSVFGTWYVFCRLLVSLGYTAVSHPVRL